MTITHNFNRTPRTEEAIAEAHPCAVDTCRQLCSPGVVACRGHWCRVPQHLRDPLIAAFRHRVIDPVGYQLARGEAIRLVRCHA